MKLLFICLDQYPRYGACTALLKNIFGRGGLVSRAEEIHVVCARSQKDDPEDEICDGVYVHRVLHLAGLSRKHLRSVCAGNRMTYYRLLISKVISKVCSRWFPFLWNDCRADKRLIKKVSLIVNNYSIDTIVPVAGFFTTVSAAIKLKKRNRAIKLIPYLVDPCSSNQTVSHLIQRIRRRFEKKFFTVSDRIIVTPIMEKEYAGRFPAIIMRKITALEFPNVTDLTAWNDKTERTDVRMMYSGSIYAGRNPRYLFELLSQVKSDLPIVVEFIGKNEAISVPQTVSVQFDGYMSVENAREILKNADFLVILGNQMTNQVPSKLFEYISYGKPIVNICRNPDCPTLQYLSKYPFAISIVEGKESIDKQAEALSSFITTTSGQRINWEQISSLFFECTPRYFVYEFLHILNV